jgi:hypothetical protein
MTPAMVEAALILRSKYAIKPDDVTAIRILAHEEAVTKPSWDSKKFRRIVRKPRSQFLLLRSRRADRG